MSSKPNRPKHSRRTSYIIAEYTVKEGTYRDVIKNIGPGGQPFQGSTFVTF